METNDHLNGIRRAALATVEKNERAYYHWITAAAIIEGSCFLAFVLLADFGNRTHLLLLVTACLVYGTLAMGLFALGAFTQSWCRRLLKAVELLDVQAGPKE